MRKCLLFLLMGLVITSCNKEGSFHYVRGTVVEKNTDIPVVGAKIYLYKDENHGKINLLVDSATTDASGEYKLKYNRKLSTDYYIKCVCTNYFNLTTNPGLLKKGKMAINFELIPYAYLKLRYIKTTSASKFAYGNVYAYGTDINISSFGTPFTSTYDITKETQIFGNTYNILQWSVCDIYNASCGQSFQNSTDFYVSKGDTVSFTITIN